MFSLDYFSYDCFKIFEMRLTNNLAIRQPKVIKEAIVCRWTNCKLGLFVVHLDGITEKVS